MIDSRCLAYSEAFRSRGSERGRGPNARPVCARHRILVRACACVEDGSARRPRTPQSSWPTTSCHRTAQPRRSRRRRRRSRRAGRAARGPAQHHDRHPWWECRGPVGGSRRVRTHPGVGGTAGPRPRPLSIRRPGALTHRRSIAAPFGRAPRRQHPGGHRRAGGPRAGGPSREPRPSDPERLPRLRWIAS